MGVWAGGFSLEKAPGPFLRLLDESRLYQSLPAGLWPCLAEVIASVLG